MRPAHAPDTDALVRRFGEDGYYLARGVLDPKDCARFVEAVSATRAFGPSLFMSEAEYNASPKSHYGTNPNPGCNILETLSGGMDFVEKSPAVHALLEAILGKEFRWIYRKLVCRVPRSALPDWVLQGIGKGPTTTLGAFVKPQYRDIAYYHDNELHQDILDYARMPAEIKEHRLITLYVYVSDVTPRDAPTCVLPGTHQRGAGRFPYHIRKGGGDTWRYTDDSGHTMETTVTPVPAPAGSLLLWHSCLLHGARPIADGRWRFGIRYMLACARDNHDTALDRINRTITGPLYLEKEFTARALFDNKNGFLLMPASDWSRSYEV